MTSIRTARTLDGGRSGVVSVARFAPPAVSEGDARGHRPTPYRRPAPSGRGDAQTEPAPLQAPRHRVSYATRPLNKGPASIPRRFGAASLSILGDPAVSGGHNCSVSLLNHTLNDLAVVSASKLGTDSWDPEIRPGNVAAAITGIANWESDGWQLLGCSNTVVWQFAANPSQPSPPRGPFTITTTYPWTSPFSNTRTSSNPRYTCRAAPNAPGRVIWEIRPS